MIGALALASWGCSSRGDELPEGEPVPILLKASLIDNATATGSTRSAADDPTTDAIQNTEFRDRQQLSLFIKKKGGDWIANPQLCTVSDGIGTLTTSSTAYYPMDATPVEIYGVHPKASDVGNPFVVATDQTLADNYAKSDLCYSKTKEYNRQTAAQTVNFKHLLSKIMVVVDATGAGDGAVSNMRLRAKTSIPFIYPADNDKGYTLGTATTPAYIQMAPCTSTDKTAAIIPPQETSADGEMRITFDLAGVGPIAYDLPSGSMFESGMAYNYKIVVGSGITVTSTITNWGTEVDDAKTVEIGRPKLPIEYCAEFNMKDATTMASDHLKANSGFYNESASLSTFNKHVAVTGKDGTYHLPSIYEMRTLASYYDIDFNPASETIVQTGKGEQLQWGKYKKNDTYAVPLQTFYNEFAFSPSYNTTGERVAYAIRFKSSDIAGPQGYGPYTCAYRYTFLSSDTDPLCGNNRTLRIMVRYLGAYSTIELSDITNSAFWNETGVEYFERVFPDFGYVDMNELWYSNCISSYRSATLEANHPTYNDYYCMFIYNVDNVQTPLRTTGHANTQYGTAIRLFKDAE